MTKLHLIFALLLVAACTPESREESPEQPTLTTKLELRPVSNQAHLISGGDMLLEIRADQPAEALRLELPRGASYGEISEVAREQGRRRYRTLVQNLPEGDSTVALAAGQTRVELALTNYPITGPIISGPHQRPYFCLSELAPAEDGQPRRFAIGNGEFLEPGTQDEFCSVATRVDYVYYSSDSEAGFKPLANPTARPADLATTITSRGEEIPYIVRLETGGINRAIYQVAVLHDPAGPAPGPLTPPPAWNERLVYTYGGGCEAGYFQGTATGGVLREHMLAEGYALASSTLNVNAQGGCHDVISAETTMMVKEHFIENYGEPIYTIGYGGSGGTMQQLLVAGAYPGLLDGLLISNTFADAVTYFTDSQECASLLRDYVNDPARDFDDTTKAVLGGWSMWSVCDESLGQRPKRIAPGDCPASIPPEAEYHPVDNPQGVRCSIYDGMRAIFGEKLYAEINSEREFARSPHDNVGVQYGMAALNEGLIDKALFLDLNENIGGWDIDVNSRGRRTEADEDAVRIAYETGRVTSGAAGLAHVPIIDDRRYLDDIGNFHASVYSFITRARLQRDNGHAGNYVLRRHGREFDLEEDNLAQMDQWLANIRARTSSLPVLETIVQARPADLRDDCFATNGERIVDEPRFHMDRLFDNTQGPCNSLYPPHAGLRLVAGGPLTNDVLKCQLKPIDYEDYAVVFTEAEKARLESIFPQGVCDWSQPGVQQQVNRTWLSFGPSPVNRYDDRD